MARTKGAKGKGKYPINSATIAQRQSACLTRRRTFTKKQVKGGDHHNHVIADRKVPKISSDSGKLKVLEELSGCQTCEIRLHCPHYDESEDGVNKNCPLYATFRESVVDVVQNPLKYLAKKAADLDVAIQKQKMLDRLDGRPLSPEMMKATDLAMKAVKIATDAEKVFQNRKYGSKGRKLADGWDDDIVIDAELFEEKDGDKK